MKTRAIRLKQVSGGMRSIAAAAALIFASAVAQGATTFRYEAGAMYSLYQDNNGAAQTIAFEQPVGMVVDLTHEETRSQNNAPALRAANWSGVSGSPSWVWNDSYVEATVATAGGNSAAVLQARKFYRAEFEVYDYVSGSVNMPYDGTGMNVKAVSRSGKFSHTFFSNGTSLFLYSTNFIGKIRNIRVQEIPFKNKLLNGHFDTDLSDWAINNTGGGAVTWQTNTAKIDSGPTTGDVARMQQSFISQVGMWYEIRFSVSNWVGAAANNLLQIGSTNGASDLYQVAISGNGQWRAIFRATTTTTYVKFYCANDAGIQKSYNLDDCVTRELPGNHLTQATSTARPVLSARVNLLTNSEVFSNVVWTKSAATVTDNTDIAPDGKTTADTVEFATSAGYVVHGSITYTPVVGNKFTASCYAKTSTRLLNFGGATTTGTDVYSFDTLADGWYRQKLTRTLTATNTTNIQVLLGLVAGTFVLWGAQLDWGPDAGRYQRIAAATDYDAAGFPSYLRFDGVDDCLFTQGTVNFSNTDKVTLIAALQKNSDAAAGIVVELSPTVSTNTGSYALLAPASAAANAQMAARGTVSTSATLSGVASPIKLVQTGIADIAGSLTVLRVNGTVTTNNATLGTGNFGDYQMFVGRRNNATVQANIQLYTLHGFGIRQSPDNVRVLETYGAGAMS